MIRTRLSRIRVRVGRRGASLLAFAFIDYVVAWSLWDPEIRAQTAALPAYRAVIDVAPLAVWAAAWLTVALTCTVQAAMRRDLVAYGAAIGVKVVWAGGMMAAWVFYEAPRAWLSASLWGVLAALVVVIASWREPR